MHFWNWFLGVKKDSDVFPKGVEKLMGWGGNYLLSPWITNSITAVFSIIPYLRFDQNFLDSYVPGLSKKQYSKLLHGVRFALKHMIDDERFEPGDTSPFWCIEVLSLQDFLNRISGQNEDLAYPSETTTRVLLPRLIFSSKKNEYFQDINPTQKFNLNDPAVLQQPRWVLRLKKIWNILFLVEQIFQMIETNPKNLLYPENLDKFNEAYQLFFELDIDLIGLIEKNIGMIHDIYQHYFPNFAKDEKNLKTFFQDIGYYSGLVTSKMGYSRGLIDFSLKAKQLSPQILSWLTNLINELVQFVATKSKIVVQSQRLEKLQHEIQNFEKKPQFFEKNALEIFFELLQFIHKPSRNKVIKLIRQMAMEHETLVIEVLRLLKYEVFPFGLGMIEDLENELMLEPGSLLGPLEIFSQHIYHSFIEFLDFHHQNDLKHLYSQNWFIVREENAYCKWAKLKYQQDQLNILRKHLDAENIPPIQQFKFLYEYLQLVDSLCAEKLRKNFDSEIWDESKNAISNILTSHLAQIDNQLSSLDEYLDKHQFVKHHAVVYFELKSKFKISYHDLTDDQKAHCQRFRNQSDKMAEIQRFILNMKEDELQKTLRHPESGVLWLASTLLVLFQGEHYLIRIKNDDVISIERKPDLNLGFQPKKNKPIFLSGYMIEKLGIMPDGNLTLHEDIPRFSIEIRHYFKPVETPIIIKALKSKDAALYLQDLNIKFKKIVRVQSKINLLQSLIRSDNRSIEYIQSSYFELRGVFKALFPKDFETLDRAFLTPFESAAACEKLLERMDKKLAEHLKLQQETFRDVFQHYEKTYFQEKMNEKLQPHAQAGHLMHSHRYSASLTQWLQKFNDMLRSYASPALFQQLRELGSDSAVDMSRWAIFSYPGKAIVYLHNLLFLSKKFYLGVEKLKKHPHHSVAANSELGYRIMTIVDYFNFQNLALFYFPFNRKSWDMLVEQINLITYLRSIFQRYSNIYSLKEKSEYAFLNSSIISQHVFMHLFENKSIRAYLFEGKNGQMVEQLAYRLADDKHLLDTFKHIKKYEFFREYRYDLIALRLKYLKFHRNLHEIGAFIENQNKAKNKVQYVVYHSYLKQLQLLIDQRTDDFHQLLDKRDEIFFKILEKNIQNLTHELKPLEQVLSHVFFARSLNREQLRMIQDIQNKKESFLIAKRQIIQLDLDIKKLSLEWKMTNQQFEAIQPIYSELDQVNQWLFDLIKKLIEQAEFEIQPRLEPQEKLSLSMILSGKSNSHPQLKWFIQRLLMVENDKYYFSPCVFTAKDRIIKTIIQRYFSKNLNALSFSEMECLNKFRNEPALDLLIEYQEERLLFKSYELSVIEQWLLEWVRHEYRSINKNILNSINALPLKEFYSLWPIQSLLMRKEMYTAFRSCHRQKNEVSHRDLEITFQKQVEAPLKSFELLNFRAQYLREAHLQSRKMMQMYAYIDQKKFLYQLRYLIFSPMFIEYLRNGFSVLRDQCIENISLISPALSSPILIYVDGLEMSLNLGPGLLSNMIENYLNDFCMSFAHQISVSPLKVPMMIQQRALSINERIEYLLLNFGLDEWLAHRQVMLAHLQAQNQTIELKKFIYECLIEYTKLFANVLEQKFGVLSHPSFLEKKKVFEFLKAYTDSHVQSLEKKGLINEELYREFIPQVQAGTQDSYFQAFCYKTFESYLKSHLHECKQLNDLAMILDAFDHDLQKTRNNLLIYEKQFQTKSQDWSSWIYKVFLILPQYYFMNLIYYRFQNLKIIEEKQKQIATLKTSIHHSEVQNIHQVIEHFQAFFQQAHIQNTLQKRATPSWHLFYFLIEVGMYFVDSLYALAHALFPGNHQFHLTQDECYIHQIQQTLQLKAKDVPFDYQNAIALLFKPKSELSAIEAHMLRKSS